MKEVFKILIRFYQKGISPFFPSACRFYPTCSHYAYEAFDKHGTFKGLWLSIKRISKCHPFHQGGVDLVPNPKEKLINNR